MINPNPPGTGKRLHFPGLNAIRAYAALSVLIVHVKQNFGELRTQPAYFPLLDRLVLDAHIAVDFFLVLSGFLISYLLLFEKDQTGKIDTRKFYLRRILRIWPLYYLIAAIGLFILPLLMGEEYVLTSFPFSKSVLVLILLPNFVGSLGPLGHLWSIGLEQQFYLLWPWVLKSSKRFVRVCVGIILVKLAVAPIINSFSGESIGALFLSLRFESLAVGALGAYAYFHNHRILEYVYSPLAQIAGFSGVILLALFDVPLTYINHLWVSVLFIVFILNIATNPDQKIILDNKYTDAIGKVSYGIYMYHYPILYLTIIVLNKYGVQEGNFYSFLLYGITLLLTITVSMISYRVFESKFLKMKGSYTIIRSQRLSEKR
jgi:peptidoglycan/LPS O-acetylase OafA/YrhL